MLAQNTFRSLNTVSPSRTHYVAKAERGRVRIAEIIEYV